MLFLLFIIFGIVTCFEIQKNNKKEQKIYSQYIIYYYDTKIKIGNNNNFYINQKHKSMCREILEKTKNNTFKYSILYEYTSLKACSIKLTKRN